MTFKPLRVDLEFQRITRKIQVDRISRKIDLEPKSLRRITKGMANLIKEEPSIYERLVTAPMENDARKPIFPKIRRKK